MQSFIDSLTKREAKLINSYLVKMYHDAYDKHPEYSDDSYKHDELDIDYHKALLLHQDLLENEMKTIIDMLKLIRKEHNTSYIDRYNKAIDFVYHIKYLIDHDYITYIPDYESTMIWDFMKYVDDFEHIDEGHMTYYEFIEYNDIYQISFDKGFPYTDNYIKLKYKGYTDFDDIAQAICAFDEDEDECEDDQDVDEDFLNEMIKIRDDIHKAEVNGEFDTYEYKSYYKYMKLCEFMYMYSARVNFKYILFTNEDKRRMCENFIEYIDHHEHEAECIAEFDKEYAFEEEEEEEEDM